MAWVRHIWRKLRYSYYHPKCTACSKRGYRSTMVKELPDLFFCDEECQTSTWWKTQW